LRTDAPVDTGVRRHDVLWGTAVQLEMNFSPYYSRNATTG